MIIAVMGSAHGLCGVSTAALLLSLMLSQKKSVCLTHLSARSDVFNDYFGLQAQEDSLSSPSQVVKLLREGSITKDELADYTLRVSDSFDIFCNNTAAINENDMAEAQKYLMSGMPHNFIVADVDTTPDSEAAAYALDKASVIVLCVTQSVRILRKAAELLNKIGREKTIILCNHYSQKIGTMQELARTLGVSAKNQICVLRHTDCIPKLANEGRLDTLPELAKNEPLPTIESDLKILADSIMSRHSPGAARRTR